MTSSPGKLGRANCTLDPKTQPNPVEYPVKWTGRKKSMIQSGQLQSPRNQSTELARGQWHSESTSETSGVVCFTWGWELIHHTRSGKVCKQSFSKD